MNIIAKLSAVLNTLDGVEVKGRENLDRLLGCMQTVEEVLQALTVPTEAEENKEETNGG